MVSFCLHIFNTYRMASKTVQFKGKLSLPKRIAFFCQIMRKEWNSQSKFERIRGFLGDEFHLPQICTEAAKASKSGHIHCDKVLQDVNVELCRNTKSQLDNEVQRNEAKATET